MSPSVDGLERRDLMTGGSVVQSGVLISVTPAPAGPNVATISYQQHNGTKMIDVNLNGADHYFGVAQVGFLYYFGYGATGSQTFSDSTSLHVVAYGGSGANQFFGGSGQDDFYGGNGSNDFVAGTGYDVMVGGNGPNTFVENSSGSGDIIEIGPANTVTGTSAKYQVS